ncbi:protein mono-ADP-ribosyltransferase PARP14-like [Embiotoca jacksoni]|uniref:protein mono-ADP-ribosyltransferase PARP14-like n=1 Tax=Embiotoca jacksoni TaxID=100190 RepID=UPI0037042677
MGDAHQYPVYFDGADLSAEVKKKIENYFQIRRKSGGGECGPVIKVKDKVYSVAFKEQEALQRVLQRPEHVVEFAGGPLVLTVRGGSGAHSSPSNAASTSGQSGASNLDSASSSQHSTLPSSLPPNVEEYELQLDSYILRYLKECPKADKDLQTALASVSCSAQVYPEGRVSVRRVARPGAADEDRNWKAVVDQLFHGYLCHYELNSHKVKALLQSSSAPQTDADEVKVYSEAGMVVVVGKCSQVNARLTDVEGSDAKHRGSHASEKRTHVCRLGEAKLRLIGKEIEHSLGQQFPGVTATQGDPGQLVLTASVEEILKAGELISDKKSLVLERIVSDKSPYFLAFLRKAYGGLGALCNFLGVGDKVEIELTDTDLHVFALSRDKLNDTEKQMQEKFRDLKFDVPNCSALPSELRDKLKSKMNEMNQGQCRTQVVFGPDSTVWLLGRTKEVEELSETVTQFILDKASVEGNVLLPFPELVHVLPELLKLHRFDYSGVTFHPATSSSQPLVVLEGPSSKVTEVRNRLGPFLDCIVQDRVTIDLPGAVRYFDSPSGRESILSVADSQKCLIQLGEQPHTSRQNLGVVKYSLQNGLKVLVLQGDITKQYADALVNAANEDLKHHGGIAAALSKAGGPQVQTESKAIVKNNGRIPIGHVVVTTGGNLKCKKLLHAVGPVGGQVGGRERELVEKTVQSSLNLAEIMQFKSIAIPCISSGLFGVPVTVCSEAIVTAVKTFGSQGGRSLSEIILIDNRAEVVRAMQQACDRLLQGMTTGNNLPSDANSWVGASEEDTARGASARAPGAPGGGVRVEIVQGTIETQQVDAVASPMVNHDPLSTRVGNVLSNLAGPQLAAKFHNKSGGATLPGDIVVVENLPPLQCKAVIFLNLLCWDNNPHGSAVQALRKGIRKILASCDIRGFTSVALPVLGTGAVLRFLHSLASKVLLEEVAVFEQNRVGRPAFLVRIIVHPSDKESSKALQSAQNSLHLRGFTNDAHPDQASFYRHVSVTNDEVTAKLGGVQLQIICGDIINGGTDVIVNTTDFSNNHSGVSQAILTAAGPTVQAELRRVGNPADDMCTTGPGLLGCREIIHARFHSTSDMIRKNCNKILKQCESKGYQSVAFPAINTGQAGMDPNEASKAMLDGMSSAITELKPRSLSLIRIVIFQQMVFQAFRSQLENRFGLTAPSLSLRERAKQILKKVQDRCSRTSTSSAPQGQSFVSPKPQPAVMRVITCCPDIVKIVKKDLEGILQQQLVKRELNKQDLLLLDAMELDAVQAKLKVSGISLEPGSNPRQNIYVLRGLSEDVLSVIELINRAIQKALFKDLQDKEEALLGLNVQWSIQDAKGVWQELSLHYNYVLEEAFTKKEAFVEVVTLNGRMLNVNPTTGHATDSQIGLTYKVKRTQSETALELPEYWEPMHDKLFKKVELLPNSPEYQAVAQGFLKTATYRIHKIELVQNLYLWEAYSVCKKRIKAKNGQADVGEKSLYHGTSAVSCDCIERDRFDRGYAGAHAAIYGKGVYFAVDASYSARQYSPADGSGLKRLYVARVLTGRYTVGNSSLKAAPPRGKDRTDCFDSVVDNQQQPAMFVIFHDDQAYPEYLITFS